MMEQKISIRFYNDREVRAVWDDASSSWLFSVVDIVGILSGSKNARNYWKVLKYRLKESAPELVTKCNQLKLLSTDGKSHFHATQAKADIRVRYLFYYNALEKYYQAGNILSPTQDNVIGQQVVDQFEKPDNYPSVSAISTKYSSLTNILSASTIN